MFCGYLLNTCYMAWPEAIKGAREGKHTQRGEKLFPCVFEVKDILCTLPKVIEHQPKIKNKSKSHIVCINHKPN